MAKEYDVGYGRPPRQTQFKKGQSGNPRGRPKDRQSLTARIMAVLNEKVAVVENRRRKRISKIELAVKQQMNKAAAGDPRAFRELMMLVQSASRYGLQLSPGDGDEACAELPELSQKEL